MSEQDPERQRWDELAKELGLEPPAPAVAESPAVPVAPRPEPIPAMHIPLHQESEPNLLWPAEDPLAEPEPESVPAEAAADEAMEPPAALGPTPEEQPGRGRRRGRRSGRGQRSGGRAPAEAGSAEASVEPDAGSAPGDSDDSPRQRGRGRGRGRQGRPAATAVLAEGEEEVVLPEPTTADDIEDADVFDPSKWDVPSWQDLIDSLYRPDR